MLVGTGGREGGTDLMYECEIETKRFTTSANQKPKTKKEGKERGKIMKVILLQGKAAIDNSFLSFN